MSRRQACVAAALACALSAATPSSAAPSRAASDPTVVIAVVDGGLNAYHAEFAARGAASDPRVLVPGYPKDARRLPLTLNASDYDAARAADDRLWRSLEPGRLYWIPGTKIAGLIHLPGDAVDRANEASVDTGHPERDVPVIDASAHGTPVSSLAVGNTTGSCPRCLLVHIAASDQAEGLAWAASQPWIDVVSNSWGDLGAPVLPHPVARGAADASLAAHRAGKAVVFAAGNGATGASPYAGGALPDRGAAAASPSSGPPWVIAVGGHASGRPTSWHSVPVDVLAEAQAAPAAAAGTQHGKESFFGTSAAAPAAAGSLAEALRLIRHATSRKSARGALASAASRPGALADGQLTQRELTAAFLRAATPADGDHPFAISGWGIVDRADVPTRTAAVVLGRQTTPVRPADETDHERMTALRTQLWGDGT